MATVASLLQAARAQGVERLDATALLEHVTGRPRTWLIAHDDAPLGTEDQARIETLLARRAGGEPLAYLLGEREFHGLSLAVGPDVLIPRPDTETLVDWALELLPADGTTAVADLGTGSGAIALAIKRARPLASVCAVDASPAALAVARANGERLGLAVEWLQGNWWEPLAGRRFGLVLSNPPYIEEGDEHLHALRFEPLQALTSGPDGLDSIRAIVVEAPARLEAKAWLLLEHGHLQAAAVCALLRAAGFEAVGSRADLAGNPRVSGGRWPGG
ncbi:peptide chain release factor N(5)-glutamine methyltransferase [Rivibacter subsaxonicus]|uniref:Release factor glutamine methyltransferase n=1 Tax=Rivibacter subsaxonicus TaxID=457575 RepID=A0A4Q7VG75_9BURK|nr:peptide chain release factor N(5)-glutamine methyltransferase [Rivibacter subsaxonicus]RZT95023.1 [protein release factor]-glutamine N5-methyltransferase [Rivibacter subsaxonicus]